MDYKVGKHTMEDYQLKYIHTNKIFMIVWAMLACVYLWFAITMTSRFGIIIEGMLFGIALGMIWVHIERNMNVKHQESIVSIWRDFAESTIIAKK